jgi:hypothetical protein
MSIHVREGDTVITNLGRPPFDWVAQAYADSGQIEVVGPREAALMLRAKNSQARLVMTCGERERLAAGRLVARGLLIREWEHGTPYLRRFYSLTERGKTRWLLVRSETS